MSRGLVSSLVGGHQLLQLLDIGSSEVGNFGLVLDVDEGRHGGDLANNVVISLDHFSALPYTQQQRPHSRQRPP